MYDKIQLLLEAQHRGFSYVCSFIDKKQLEKILLLSYLCNAEAGYQQGFCEMLLLFHLLVEREHEVYWLFQFFPQKTSFDNVWRLWEVWDFEGINCSG
ncbi:unnamed protein product [Bubo scandiacus]